MPNPKDIAIAEYDYPLPNERIAKFPIAQRDHSKLLVLNHEQIEEHTFFELPDQLLADAM